MNTLTLQRHLHRLGFDPGACDGAWGPKTSKAFQDWYVSAPGGDWQGAQLNAEAYAKDGPDGDALLESLILEASQHIVDGIDTSYFQTTQDWTKLAKPLERDDIFAPRGFEFCIARASYGTSNDTTFIEKAQAALGAGVATFAYHFVSPLATPGPQIDTLAGQCAKAGLTSATVALDLEWTPPGMKGAALVEWFNAKKDEILDNLRAEVALSVAAFGKKPLVYFYPFYWQALGAAALSAEWTACPLWLSAPTKAGGLHKPVAPWPSVSFHQWTDDANVVVPVDGYGGPHVLADRFAGTLEELRALVRRSV